MSLIEVSGFEVLFSEREDTVWKLLTFAVSLMSIGTGASALIDGASVPMAHLALMFVEVVIFVTGVFIHFCMPPSNQVA